LILLNVSQIHANLLPSLWLMITIMINQ